MGAIFVPMIDEVNPSVGSARRDCEIGNKDHMVVTLHSWRQVDWPAGFGTICCIQVPKQALP